MGLVRRRERTAGSVIGRVRREAGRVSFLSILLVVVRSLGFILIRMGGFVGDLSRK